MNYREIKKLGGGVLMAALLVGCSASERVVTVSVHNPLGSQREGEMVEVNLKDLKKIQLKEGENYLVYNKEKSCIPSQVTHNGLLIFPVTVSADGTAEYTIRAGQAEPVKVTSCGRFYPERLDDIAWENDKAAYRAYGPALQKRGERAFGYDVFTKSVDYPVVEKRYAMELDTAARARMKVLYKQGRKAEADSISHAISYHIDHGNGMDVYNVGPTLGGGTAALMDGDQILYPYCFKEYEILDNGPLRFSMKLTYNPMTVKADTNVVETRIVSLDAGSHLNKTEIVYQNLTQPATVAAGLVMHEQNPKGYAASAADRYIAYADSTSNAHNNNGVIYVGASFPKELTSADAVLFPKKISDAIGHVLGTSAYQPGETFTYYWGSGWSKGGVQDMNAWTAYLKDFSARLKAPLEIKVK